MRLAQSLVRAGHNVIYVYWNWSDADREQRGEVANGLYTVSRSDFLRVYREVLEAVAAMPEKHLLLFELPDPQAIPVLSEASGLGLQTVYDVLDDWEEFHKLGQAPWFEESAEHFFLRNCTRACGVTQALAEKLKPFPLTVIPNGFDPGKLTDRPAQKVPRGTRLTAGYFGYLTDAWFDWELLFKTAQANAGFMFHLLGYGMPQRLKLPPNIKYLGKVHPNELSGYAKNWDVCLIPFKDGVLARSADPIKLYEYLYFEKPVVVTGLPHLASFPYVFNCEGTPKSFKAALLKARQEKIDHERIAGFLKGKTWQDRALELLGQREV